MEIKEVIQRIKKVKESGMDYFEHEKNQEAYALAVSALEKQEAKKMVIVHDNEWNCDFPHCPTCSVSIDSIDTYCYKCGQKLTREE